MKNMKNMAFLVGFLVTGLCLFALAGDSYAGTYAVALNPLGTYGSAMHGATHVVECDYNTLYLADNSTSVTNVPLTNTVAIGAGKSVQLVKMKTDVAFDTSNTNYLGSLTVTVGDANDVDKYLTSTQLASDSTNVWSAVGRTVWDSGVATNTTLSYGYSYYPAATNVLLIFTPNAEEHAASNTKGRVSFYFNVW